MKLWMPKSLPATTGMQKAIGVQGTLETLTVPVHRLWVCFRMFQACWMLARFTAGVEGKASIGCMARPKLGAGKLQVQ